MRAHLTTVWLAWFSLASCDVSSSQDEREVLSAFMGHLQDPDCDPGWTTPGLKPSAKISWVEADEKTKARLDVALKRAASSNRSVTTGGALSFLFWKLGCKERVQVGTPSFYGNYAFVTSRTATGVSTDVFERSSGKWEWISLSSNGDPITYY